jgi:uncharacterized tellurite resistance protein B-like protein
VLDELTKNYEVLPKYHTHQKIIQPILSSASNSDAEASDLSPMPSPLKRSLEEKQARK